MPHNSTARILEEKTRAARLALAERTPPPVPVVLEHPRPAFPIETIPAKFRAFAEALAGLHLCPVDLPATMMLGVVSGILARHATVRVMRDWSEP